MSLRALFMGLVTGVAMGVALGGCATPDLGAPPIAIDTRYRAQGQDSRVQHLVIHFTSEAMARSVQILTQEEVSAHYLVSDEAPPRIYRLVDESQRAWHAGLSSWRGNTALNASSIGIEIVNAGPSDTAQGRVYAPYPPEQIDLVISLVKDIVARHQIKPERVVGHSDIAPQRKVDPGPQFPWFRLGELGLIPWPNQGRVRAQQTLFAEPGALPDVAWFQRQLAAHGFEVPRHGELDEPTRKVVAAFQMRYRPQRYDGAPDAETAALLRVLNTPAEPR